MEKLKNIILILLFISLSACKTSPATDEVEVDTSLTVSVNSESQDESGAEPKVVTSTASSVSTAALETSEYNVEPGEFNLYPRETSGWDESGWSIISPSEDSRLVYVSSSMGNDETAEYYAPRDISDVQDPSGIIKPYKTIHAAREHARDGYPDWILLRRGDSWEVNSLIKLRSGRSFEERAVITSYGQGIERPVLKADSAEVLRIWPDQNYMAIVGLSLYAYKRDPKSPDFSGWGAVSESLAVRMYAPREVAMGSILLEDNLFNFFSKAITIHGGGEFLDIVIRRNVILNSYSERDHAQGIYAVNVSALLEENVFDHNGWYKQQIDGGNDKAEGQATMFNHNTYFTDVNYTISRRNIFLRASSIHQKWTANSPSDGSSDQITSTNILIDSNLYVSGDVGISAGGNTDYNNGPRWRNINIVDNLMLAIGRDQSTNRTLGWYIDADDWDGGNICGNYLLHNDNSNVVSLKGINISGHSSDISVSRNVIYGLVKPSESGIGAINVNDAPKDNIRISDNLIQLVGSQMRVLSADNLDNSEYSNNRYYSDADNDLWFESEGVGYSFDEWTMLSGDTGSSANREPFADTDRSFEAYLASIGLPESIDAFVEQVAQTSRFNWDRTLTVDVISAYIRAGYGDLRCDQPGNTFFPYAN